jgi:hypothetical protein
MDLIKQAIQYEKAVDLEQGFIITGYDNLEVLKTIPDGCVDQSYIDPPFKSNKTWEKNGWKFDDKFDDMWDYLFFLGERLVEAKRVMRESIITWDGKDFYRDGQIIQYKPLIDKLTDDWLSSKQKTKEVSKGKKLGASIFVHVDYRTNNEIKTYLMDPLFGEGKSALTLDDVQTLMQAKIGKTLHTPVSVPKVDITDGPSIVLDFFGGSHSYAAAAWKTGRRFISIEMNKSEELFWKQITNKDGTIIPFGEDRE